MRVASLLLLMLGQTPPPASTLELRQSGARKGYVKTENFIAGSNVTLTVSVDGGVGAITIAAAGFDAGPSAPIDAQYWTGAANSTLTAEKNLGGIDAGLVINIGGVPSPYVGTSCTNQFPRSLNNTGVASCASVTLGTDTSGNYVATPGGNTNEVQYKSGATTLGGIANLETDGTHPSVVSETTHPSTPSTDSLLYDFKPNANILPLPMRRSAFLGTPIPDGMLGVFSTLGTTANWQVAYTYVSRIPATAATVGIEAAAQSNTTSGVAWANTNAFTRIFWIGGATSTSANITAHYRQGVVNAHYDTNAGAGGFIFKTRVALVTTGVHIRVAFGLFGTAGVLTASANPDAQTNSIYFGCNDGDANLSICSNDATTTATCNTLGSSYPCQTNGVWYDMWLVALPGGAGGIYYYIERLDSAATTGGLVSGDLPLTSVQLGWQDWVNSGAGGTAIAWQFSEARLIYNY